MVIPDLEKRLNVATALFDAEASALLKVDFVSRYGLRDRMRLLNLYTWSKRYKVPYPILFQTLVKYWRQKFSAHTFPGRLGVKPATLVGKASRDIIERFIMQTYTDNENEAIWRDTASRRIIIMLRRNEQTESGITSNPDKLVSAYRHHITQSQESSRAISKRMRRRAFRNNPFV
jgi:hypothetical protein